jgi:4-hydroxy-tetrahydrodipicolinate synthase
MRTLMDNPDPELNESLQSLMKWLFCEPNPIAINTALMMTGAVKSNFRLPYLALTQERRQQGLALLSKFDSSNLVGDKLSLLADSDFNYCP